MPMKDQQVKPGYLFSPRYTGFIFTLLFLLYMFDYIDRVVVTSMFTSIEKDWGLSHAQSGLLVSVVYWSIVLLTFPVSLLVDRWSRRKTIGIMSVLWSVATALCALTGNYTQLLFTRMLIGVGEAGYAPGGTAMIAGIYPQEKRAKMIGLWNASIPLGTAIGVALGGIIAAKWGWKNAFGIVALPGLIVAVLFFFVKDYKTVDLNISLSQQGKTRMKTSDIFNEFIKKPSLIYTYFGIASVAFVTTSMITWFPRYLQDTLAISQRAAGMKASAVMALAIIGAPLGGYLSDRWRKHRIRARLLFPSLTTAISAVFLFIAFHFLTGLLQYIFFLMFGILVTAFISAASAVTQDVVHFGLRAVSYSFAVFVQNLLGSSLAPIAIGKLYDVSNIQTAMSILPAMLLLGSFLFYKASKHYETDLQKVEQIELEVDE
jgi:predicted MFS family arabinose efflux permease